MEWRLAKIVSNLLVLQFKTLTRDMIEKFFDPSKWNNLHLGAEISFNKEVSGDDQKVICIAEINLMMSRLGILDVGFEEYNGNGNKSLDAGDFSALFDEEEPSLDEIKETFGVFDVNKDGFIDASELQGLLCNLGLEDQGCKCNLEECKRMIQAFDCNGDGVIDFEEFVKFMEKCL